MPKRTAIGKADYELAADTKKLDRDLKRAEGSIKKSGKAAEQAWGKQGTQAAKKMGRAQSVLVKQSSALKKGVLAGVGVGGGVLAFAALAAGVSTVVGGFKDSLNAARDFEMGLATVNTVAQVSAKDLEKLGKQTQVLAVRTGKTTGELTDAMYNLVSAGVPAAKVMSVLEDSTTLATGALSSTNEAVDLITSSLNAWMMSAEDSTRVMDVWAKTVALGKTTAGQLAASIANIAPVAAVANVEIEEVAAALATMTAQGTQTSMATTQLATAISAFTKTNRFMLKEQAKLEGQTFESILATEGLNAAFLKLIEVTGGDSFRLTKALGSIEAYKALAQTTGAAQDTFNANMLDMRRAADVGGDAVSMMDERMGTYAAQQERMNAALEVMRQEIGELMLGPATDFAMWMADMLGPTEAMSERFLEIRLRLFGIAEAAEEAAGEDFFGQGALQDAQKNLQSWGDASKDTTDRFAELIEGSGNWSDIMGDLAPRLGLTTREGYTLVAMMAEQGMSLDQIIAQLISLGQEYDALADAEARAGETAEMVARREQMGESMRARKMAQLERLTFAMSSNKAKGRELSATMRELNASSLRLAAEGLTAIQADAEDADKTWKKLIKRGDGNKKAIRALNKEIGKWERRYKKAIDANDSEAAAYAAARLTELEDERLKRIEVRNMTKQQKDKVEALNDEIEKVEDKTATVTVDTDVIGEAAILLKGYKVKLLHSGGPTDAHESYIVGEEGPELWTERRPGFMYDARATQAILNRSSAPSVGQPSTVHVHAHIHAGAFLGSPLDAENAARQLAPALNRHITRINP